MTFEELINSLPGQEKNDLKNNLKPEDISQDDIYKELDCLISPKKHDVIWDKEKNLYDNMLDKISLLTKDTQDVLNIIKDNSANNKLVYAMIAPAFLGQFSDQVTPGKLRSALKYLGFTGMVEVSLFADILTLIEALEFNQKINNESDFMLTSCCCPMWIGMLRKNNLLSHVPGTVSPMLAAARSIKIIHPEAITVFIGPCMAKKTEAHEEDLDGATDYVLTFQEINSLLNLFNIKPETMPEINRDHSSKAGRIYARAGGVSQSIVDTVKKLNPDKKIVIKCANGVIECKKLMEEFKSPNKTANFYEGMGCLGGCVGGPKKIIDKDIAKQNVDNYADTARYATPLDNPYVIKLLNMLGFDTVESLLSDNKIFARHFS